MNSRFFETGCKDKHFFFLPKFFVEIFMTIR